jgi:Na+/proline symporter
MGLKRSPIMRATTKATLALVAFVVLVAALVLAVGAQPQNMVDPLAAAIVAEFLLAIVMLVVVAIIGVALYILPVLVAVLRKHPDAVAISVLSILLGWTLLGWVFALVWALNGVRKQKPQVIIPQPPGDALNELPRFGSTTVRQETRN